MQTRSKPGCYKKDEEVDENMGIKVEVKIDIKGGAIRLNVQTRHKIGLKTRRKT